MKDGRVIQCVLVLVVVGVGCEALFDVFNAESLASLQVLVTHGTLEDEEAMRDVLHHIQSDSLVQGLQSPCHLN